MTMDPPVMSMNLKEKETKWSLILRTNLRQKKLRISMLCTLKTWGHLPHKKLSGLMCLSWPPNHNWHPSLSLQWRTLPCLHLWWLANRDQHSRQTQCRYHWGAVKCIWRTQKPMYAHLRTTALADELLDKSEKGPKLMGGVSVMLR